jgi:hypothetical protein
MKKFFIIFLLTITINAFSQSDPEDGDATVPVDGGISLLLLAAAGYGANILSRRDTSRTSQTEHYLFLTCT